MRTDTNCADSDNDSETDSDTESVSGSLYKPSKDGKIQKNSQIEIPFRILYNRYPSKECSNYELALKEYTDIIKGSKSINGEIIKMNAVGILNSCKQLIEILQSEGGHFPPMEIFLKDTWANYITCGDISQNQEIKEE